MSIIYKGKSTAGIFGDTPINTEADWILLFKKRMIIKISPYKMLTQFKCVLPGSEILLVLSL